MKKLQLSDDLERLVTAKHLIERDYYAEARAWVASVELKGFKGSEYALEVILGRTSMIIVEIRELIIGRDWSESWVNFQIKWIKRDIKIVENWLEIGEKGGNCNGNCEWIYTSISELLEVRKKQFLEVLEFLRESQITFSEV